MLHKSGKKAKEWVRIRRLWVRLNPPDHQGGYLCGICAIWVHMSDMELDHIEPRSRGAQSFEDLSNLQPTHSICNRRKGSRVLTPKVPLTEYELRKKLKL